MTDTTSAPIWWKAPASLWILLGVAAVLVGYAFMDTIQDMVYRWDTQEEYGYGYLIPVITLFLIWQRKNQLAEIEFNPSFSGLLLILFGGALFFLGAVATTNTLSQYGLVVTIMGIALALLGWRAFRIVMVPLALLFFMVPLPPFIYNTLSTKLQLISSQLGVEVIRGFGISVYLEGNVIDLGTYKLQVVEACSGLRYLFPLATLSFLAAYLYREKILETSRGISLQHPDYRVDEQLSYRRDRHSRGVWRPGTGRGIPALLRGLGGVHGLHCDPGAGDGRIVQDWIEQAVARPGVFHRVPGTDSGRCPAAETEAQAAVLGGSGAAGGDCGIQSVCTGTPECDTRSVVYSPSSR